MNSVFRLTLLCALFCLGACAHMEGANGPKEREDITDSSYTLETARVEEVLQAFEGNYKNIAYVVAWNGSRVAVEDPSSSSTHREGDTINFMAQRVHIRR